MLPNNKNQTGYTSCIKIFGVPILPPLITEERRKELNEAKQRAIEIEKRLSRKRSSIDSGVMIGSYIEHFRNSESQLNSELCLAEISDQDLTNKEKLQNDASVTSFEAVNCVVSDSFLKTALEDPEFREFFSSTAEKIFKDNKVENGINETAGGDLNSHELQYVLSNESDNKASEVLSESSSFVKPLESIELSFNDTHSNLSQVPSVVDSDTILETAIVVGNGSEKNQREDQRYSPPPARIRRNSYTLENPSSALLEHMAKEIATGKGEGEKWQTLSDKKEKQKGPGFKTFSGRNQRKHWNKKICNPSSNLRVENNRTKYTLGRSNTFVKSGLKVGESNYSLPCSTRTSPLQFCSFTRSVDCIKSMGANVYRMKEEVKGDFSVNTASVSNLSISKIPFQNTIRHSTSDTETASYQKDVQSESASVETSPTSLINNPSNSAHSNCGTANSSPPQIEFSDSASQISVATLSYVQSNSECSRTIDKRTSLINNPSNSVHSDCGTANSSPPQIEFNDSVSQISVATLSTYVQPNSECSRNIDKRNTPNNLDGSEDFDDLTSLCSSMSISRFLPHHDTSRPSTAEDLSEANIRQLKMKHENELRELLEKQRKEEEIYSQMLSSSGSLSSRTTTNLSLADLFENKSEHPLMNDSRNSCNRELFPFKNPSDRNQTNQLHDYSQREKEAATKLTAYAKGYLTRRLLMTEKVQQLIDLIKESLTCAFSLQLESHLKPSDLELHAHLARQLNAALKEFQIIISAPVAARMAIIAADRERLRRPVSRPSSTISTATRKSILRRQQSLNSAEKNPQESRPRTKSFSDDDKKGSFTSRSHVQSSSGSSNSSRMPWR